jgi:hypothetical protein
MKKSHHLISLFLLISSLGCATVRTPALGLIYTQTKSGVAATSNSAGTKTGEACAESYFGLVATGDASIETARKEGGITTITSVDESSKNIIGVYGKYCTLVRGR